MADSPQFEGFTATPAQLEMVRAAESTRVDLVRQLAPTVVCIFPPGNRNGGGSGVLIDAEGHGLTNYHVIASLGEPRRGEGGCSDGVAYPLEVLGFDPAGDIAMFRLTSASSLPFAPLGDSAAVRLGDESLAMGNPFLLAEDFQPTVTFGIISGLHRYLAGQDRSLFYTDCLEINTSINPGNSGGPLFDMGGRLIGINGRIGIEERGRVNVGVGYAVSMRQIRRFIPALRAGLVTPHATLGATVMDAALHRVAVEQILESSDAWRAGLREGDRLNSLDGVALRSANQLASLVAAYPAYWPVTVEIERGAEKRTLHFQLDDLPLPRAPRMPRDIPEQMQKKMIKPLSGINWDANALETRRTFDRWLAAVGGREAAASIGGWKRFARRAAPAAPGDRAEAAAIESAETAPPPGWDRDARGLDDDALEAAVRLSLLNPPAEPRRAEWQVLRGDEVGGRLAIVLSRVVQPRRDVEVTFDFESGELLRIAFQSAGEGGPRRYEYGDVRAAGALRLPHRRVCFVDHALKHEERIERYELRTRD